MDISLCRVSR